MYRFIVIILVGSVTCKPKEVSQEFSFKKKDKAPLETPSTSIDLKNKGIGPIIQVSFGDQIDTLLLRQGKTIYEGKCIACHRIETTFIGPPSKGILKRRTPEWVMNMLLNTDEMLRKDSLAKALFMEFNGQLMTNQNLTKEEARAVLEYFRTL